MENLYWISALTYAIVLGLILFDDIRATKKPSYLEKHYRTMTMWVIFFCVQDCLWGLCEGRIIRNDAVFFVSSSIFHISTVVTTYFWLRYVLAYLGDKVRNAKFYLIVDAVIVFFQIVLIIINCFHTTLFSIVDGAYVTGFLRPMTFANQYIVYFVISVVTLVLSLRHRAKGNKHFQTVFLFTLAPIVLGVLQLIFPNAPFYSLGYFLGCFVIHIFVVKDEREVYLSHEEKMERITQLNQELKEKQTELDEQYRILHSISGVYDYINIVDLNAHSAALFNGNGDVDQSFDMATNSHTALNKKLAPQVDPLFYDRFWEYTDLSTLEARMKGKKLIATEFKFKEGDWVRAMYIRIGEDVHQPISQVAYTIRNITKERKREEQVYAAMANLVYSLHVFDLENDTKEGLIESDIVKQIIGNEESAQRMADTIIRATCKDEYLDIMLDFVNLSTVSERMRGKKFLSCEFIGKYHGWTRMTFIPIEMNGDVVKKMVTTTQIIDSEKTEMINLVYKSSTDELTRIYNRRMYEEELDAITESGDRSNLIVVAMDVNGLKTVNDTLGHKAGDELIIGASRCIEAAFRRVGKVYRTGGDEFMAILRCPTAQMPELVQDFEEKISAWTGSFVDHLSISHGHVTAEEMPELSIRDLASEADKRMYAAKSAYYVQHGIERRRR